ncbi:MAG TPA: asparagine synthase-related protein [Candidatus Acidoferrales bacterium]|nr:asparagine synthase-related protein [Candidatus Acidoferrales bacterium]
MSGIAGIVHGDGSPVNAQLLREMTRALSFRGPDGQETRAQGSAGLGHALLQTTQENRQEHQPASLDQETWIVADARLDAREDLVQALGARGREVSKRAPDCELLLHAYAEWDEDCVEHILGDFAFAIWDGRRKRLFCACDHFGIKMLYFAELRNGLVFSNTLECVRQHPEVSERLNDAAIADFLLFGLNYNTGTTSYADIRRLPPAHVLRLSAEGLRLRRYWMPPSDGNIRYRRRTEYVEHFAELLKKAVEERLPTNAAGIFLSGGLDSSSLAATACELRKEKFPALKLHAFTTTLLNAPEDLDAAAARVVANALQIPHHMSPLDDGELFEGWEDARACWPEPVEDPFAAGVFEQYGTIAEKVRVVFSGEGSDNLMDFEMAAHIRMLWREGRVGQLSFNLAEHMVRRFQAPDGLRGPLRRVGRLVGRRKPRPALPSWLNHDLVARLDLKKRWENPLAGNPSGTHPVHPRGYKSLFLPQWRQMFVNESAEITRQPVEVRYPFLDLRLASFLLAIPTMPWFFRKHLLREAMRGRLPEEIRMRPKTPLQEDPLIPALRKHGVNEFRQMHVAESLDRYVDLEALPPLGEETDAETAELKLRPRCLNFWLQSSKRIGYKIATEAGHAKAVGSKG